MNKLKAWSKKALKAAQLPTDHDLASVVDDLVDALGRVEGERGAQASVLAALSGLCATVPGARERDKRNKIAAQRADSTAEMLAQVVTGGHSSSRAPPAAP